VIKHHFNFIKKFGYSAITFGRHVFLSDEVYNDKRCLAHEQVHVNQYKRYGFIKFLIVYVYNHFKYGYYNNPLEVEAREAEVV